MLQLMIHAKICVPGFENENIKKKFPVLGDF